MSVKSNKHFDPSLLSGALKQSFVKLKPGVMLKNPVMFIVYIGTIIMMGVCLDCFRRNHTGFSFL